MPRELLAEFAFHEPIIVGSLQISRIDVCLRGFLNNLGKPFHRVESATGVTATGIQSRGSEARTLKISAGLSSEKVWKNTTRPSRSKFFKNFRSLHVRGVRMFEKFP